MSKISKTPRQSIDPETQRFYAELARQLNGLSEGAMAANYAALTTAPTTGTWALGDTVINSAPAELGAPSSKYVVRGWQCLASGAPGTWVDMRYLTGN